jgi:hypothetical protein
MVEKNLLTKPGYSQPGSSESRGIQENEEGRCAAILSCLFWVVEGKLREGALHMNGESAVLNMVNKSDIK